MGIKKKDKKVLPVGLSKSSLHFKSCLVFGLRCLSLGIWTSFRCLGWLLLKSSTSNLPGCVCTYPSEPCPRTQSCWTRVRHLVWYILVSTRMWLWADTWVWRLLCLMPHSWEVARTCQYTRLFLHPSYPKELLNKTEQPLLNINPLLSWCINTCEHGVKVFIFPGWFLGSLPHVVSGTEVTQGYPVNFMKSFVRLFKAK